jgi:uncharacterized protein (DUF2141 family)
MTKNSFYPFRFIPFANGYSLFVLFTLILSSCAQMLTPTGGPKDTTPPKVVKYSPDSAALHFKAKQIHILFNEFIQLKNINGQLIVSPPLKHIPDIKVKGKELVISITDTLEPNTTYDFNFGSAIADYTEGNVLDNFQYIFSTGSFIDSLSLKGIVKDALTLSPQKDVLVMLYNSSGDSLPFKKLPNYFAKTKENGSFKINNIRTGSYKVFALKDANSNYLYDTPEENIGFLDTLIDLKKNTNIDLLLFNEGPKKQFVKRAKVLEFGHIRFTFNKPVTVLQLKPINFNPADSNWRTEEFNTGHDTLDLWIPKRIRDTIKLLVKDDLKMSDTLVFALPELGEKDKKFKLTYKINAAGLFDINKEVKIQFNHYLATKEIPGDSIRVKEDTVKDLKNDIDIKVSNEQITILKKDQGLWKENTKYKIVIPSGLIKDVFGLKNDSIKIEFKTRELKNYGTLKLNISYSEDLLGSVFQLLNTKDEVVVQHIINDARPFTLEYLSPQEYKMRIILDKNKNKKFDTGNYLKHQQPEKVIYYPGKITIRSNWDLDQDWKIK